MTIAENKVVSLIYELRKTDEKGDILESLKPDSPLSFIYGSGQLLPKFEEHIKDSKKGDKFKFILSSNDAYGEIRKEAVVNLPINIFEADGKLNTDLIKVGNYVPMQDNEGNKLNGLVKSIKEDSVEMDFNHPLAGETLHFTGEVTEVREPKAEELENGHVHKEGNSCGSCSCDGEENCD